YCGFGCQMHHLIHGIIIAYGLERTLILESRNWQYHEGGWNEVFMPLSNSCITTDAVTTVDWPGSPDSPVIRLPLVDSLSPRSQYMPMAVPEDLVNRLKIIHGNPIIWWIRQILKYAWKLQPRTTRYINNQMERFGIKHPFVSVQVRRTDKINKESKFHSIEKYMDVVDEYYNSIDLKTNITKRRVYIATEDYSVITETKAKYPQYEILYNQNIPTIPKLHPIHLFDNIFDLILDIHILRQSDLLVCTFSSNICRLLYTLMDSDYIDESANLISIDSVYYYNNQDYNKRKVILNHNAEDANEIDLIPGDIIGVDDAGFVVPECNLSDINLSQMTQAMQTNANRAEPLTDLLISPYTDGNYEDFRRILLDMHLPGQVMIDVEFDKTMNMYLGGMVGLMLKLLFSTTPGYQNISINSALETDCIIGEMLRSVGYTGVDQGEPLNVESRRHPNTARWMELATRENSGMGWINTQVDSMIRINEPLYDGVATLPTYCGLDRNLQINGLVDAGEIDDPPIWRLIIENLNNASARREISTILSVFNYLRNVYRQFIINTNRHIIHYGETAWRLPDVRRQEMAGLYGYGGLSNAMNVPVRLAVKAESIYKFFVRLPQAFKPGEMVLYQPHCGFGCQMHHFIHGMIIAYGLERTLILESQNWHYHEGGWNEVFMPLSNSCITTDDVTTVDWPGSPDSPVIRLPLVDRLSHRSQYLPLAVPEDLVNRLKIIHGNPIVWWIGQILKYVWKLQPRTTRYINNQMERFGIEHPFVGVQIRRTDKVNKEAKFHSIEKYMDVVDEYYNSIELKTNITKRRVYIATEDYSVISETKAKYPQYEILYNQNIPKIPKLNPIHIFDNIFDLILDIHILRRSDLLVCTFSSNICRLLYTLMETDYIDESANLISIDSVYWYHNQEYNKRKVILNHNAENADEIDLIPGDILDVDDLLFMHQQSKVDKLKLLKETREELFELQKRHVRLQKQAVTNVKELADNIHKYVEPTFEYESLRRKVTQDIQELWYFLNSQMTELKNISGVDKNSLPIVNKVQSMGFEFKRALINNMETLTEVDGSNAWRNKESADLSEIVQKRLHRLQNPADCEKAKKLVCTISYYCGFGCQIHHLIHSMILAYGLERTLILESTGWQYHESGWDELFMPLSNTCTTTNNETTVDWPGSTNDKIIRLLPHTEISPRSEYLPLAVPEDLANRLKTIHGNPVVWWVGQILKYIWKPQPATTTYINNQMEKLNIKHPYVGVHVRRTDKLISEAKYIPIEKYMDVVDDYYNSIEIKINLTKRTVYIATDDYDVIKEATAKYSHYEIIFNENIPKVARIDVAHMYDDIFTVLSDIHILVHSDLLVCTFSSHMCRLMYELIQNNYVDGSAKTVSLDSVYWYNQQENNKRKVILRHTAQNDTEIDLIPGDIVNITEHSLNGYSFGTNLRTQKVGWYPSFKVEVEVEIVKFPTYSNIEEDKGTK
ncbi:hypothetical protein RN001_004121, partial [Aquatica leii]